MAAFPVPAGDYFRAGGICLLRQRDHVDTGGVRIRDGAGLSGTGNHLFRAEGVTEKR